MRKVRVRRGLWALGTTLVAASLVAPSPGSAASPELQAAAITTSLDVVATGLDSPRKLSIGPDGAIYVAEAGIGGTSDCIPAPRGGPPSCVGPTGAVTRISGGTQARVITGLSSVGNFESTDNAGPAAVSVSPEKISVIVGGSFVDQSTGASTFGTPGVGLNRLVTAIPGSAPSTWTATTAFGAFEAVNNPDGGAGADPDETIDTNPYAMVPYGDGFLVADAGGNDLLFVNAAGQVSVVAVFPIQMVTVPPGVLGPVAVTLPSQAVPTSIAIGPDGAIYVGELTGFPFPVGGAKVWRVVPGQQPTVFATGFTNISDLAFDRQGRLLVLQIAADGLLAGPNGSLLRLEANGTRTEIAAAGLLAPTGLAVGADGSIYVSNNGVFSGAGPGPRGEVLRLRVPSTQPYRFAASDGGVFTFGATGYYGSMGGTTLNSPVVGLAENPIKPGYWLVGADGGVFTFGDAGFYGSTGATTLNRPIVAMAPTPDGRGYWLVGSDGGVFSFGDARFYGSAAGSPLNRPIVGMAATPDGAGYWLFASDGGVFAYGSAAFYGSAGGMTLNRPIVGGSSTPDGKGYWLVAADGGIFAYGSAGYYGSAGGTPLNRPVVGMVASPTGAGYVLVGEDGGVFAYGDAAYNGSTGDLVLNRPVIGIAAA